MKGTARVWRTSLVIGLSACLAVLVHCAARADEHEEIARRDDVVAVLFLDAGMPQGQMTVSYPEPTTSAQVEGDLRAMAEVSGWTFETPAIAPMDSGTQAVAVMRPAACAAASYGEPVWPAVWALKRYNRVAVVVMGEQYQGAVGGLDNRFVTGRWSGGGNIRSYDVALKEKSFGSIRELSAPAASGSGDAAGPGDPRPWSGGWYIIIALALTLGVVAYVIAARAMRSPRR